MAKIPTLDREKLTYSQVDRQFVGELSDFGFPLVPTMVRVDRGDGGEPIMFAICGRDKNGDDVTGFRYTETFPAVGDHSLLLIND